VLVVRRQEGHVRIGQHALMLAARAAAPALHRSESTKPPQSSCLAQPWSAPPMRLEALAWF